MLVGESLEVLPFGSHPRRLSGPAALYLNRLKVIREPPGNGKSHGRGLKPAMVAQKTGGVQCCAFALTIAPSCLWPFAALLD